MNEPGSPYYDALETRSTDERQTELFAALPAQVDHARANTPAYAGVLADVDPAAVSSLEALATLPVTRKSELVGRQADAPPFGGYAAGPAGSMHRVFCSPGPIYEPEGHGTDYWRIARSMYAAGFRSGDLVHNTFAYHFTPAGAMMESGAHALGCGVFPAGTGQTEQQVEAIAALRPRCYAGTPSFLKRIMERAGETGADVTSLCRALVSGEAVPPGLRASLEEKGVEALQCYATADLGLIAYESPAREGMIIDEGVIVELVRPGTGDPVPEGEVGEVVVTTLTRAYPLIRFATGDLSAVLAGTSPCGRTNTRIRGWMGRADQTAKVRGMFVHPSQVAEVVRRHPEVTRARLVLENPDGDDRMVLKAEVASSPEGLADALVATARAVCGLRAEVTLHEPGALPNDGKVIDDRRSYET